MQREVSLALVRVLQRGQAGTYSVSWWFSPCGLAIRSLDEMLCLFPPLVSVKENRYHGDFSLIPPLRQGSLLFSSPMCLQAQSPACCRGDRYLETINEAGGGVKVEVGQDFLP